MGVNAQYNLYNICMYMCMLSSDVQVVHWTKIFAFTG